MAPTQNWFQLCLYFTMITIWLQSCHSQQSIILYPPGMEGVNVYNSSVVPALNTTFIEYSASYNCSLSRLYTYRQSYEQYLENTPYTMIIQGFNTSQGLNITISTQYSSITPMVNSTKSQTCFSSPCTLQIENNCHLPKINYYNYFDIIRLKISNIDTIISYYVLCNLQFQENTFEYGMLIQIVFCTFLITVVALYSNAWSIGGAGFKVTFKWVLGFNFILVCGGVLAFFLFQVVAVAVNVLSWIFGFASVWLCSNEILFLINYLQFLKKQLINLKHIKIRVLDIISCLVSIAICFAWWFSDKNWIINDFIAISIIVSSLKVLKFTSLKSALLCFCVTIIVQISFVLILKYESKQNYNTIILNVFNNPFEFQFPTINPVYNQKCAWLPVSSLIYPGALMSYMRRFDTSRSTNVYIISCVFVFLIGSFSWMFITIASSESWPFGLVAQPATIGLISFFAWKRKEIRTLWSGKFYDEEFADKEGLLSISESIEKERKDTNIVYHPDLFSGLHYKEDEDEIQYQDILQEARIVEKQAKGYYRGQNQAIPRQLIENLISYSYGKAEEIEMKDFTKDPKGSSQQKTNFPMPIQKGGI